MGDKLDFREPTRSQFDWPTALVALSLVVASVVLQIWNPAVVEATRLRLFDQLQRWAPRQAALAPPVIIVDIDEASLRELGQWPWPRTLVGQLIDKLAALGAATIAFDVLFVERDRFSPPAYAETIAAADASLAGKLRILPDSDEAMAKAMRRNRVVLGEAGLLATVTRDAARAAAVGPTVALIGADPSPYLVHFADVTAALPRLREAAAGVGLVTILPEVDGIVRRVPVIARLDGRIIPSFAVEALRVAKEQPTIAVRTSQAGITEILLRGMRIPTDDKGRLWVRYAAHDPRRTVSAADVIADRVNRDRIAGRIVLVGTSAAGLGDIKSTPIDGNMPGVEVQAQLVETMLANDHLQRPAAILGAERLAVVVLGLALTAAGPFLPAAWLPPLLVLTLGAAATVGWYGFYHHGLLIDAAFPAFTTAVLLFWLAMAKYIREESRRRTVRNAFSHYLSPVMVDRLTMGNIQLQLGGERRLLTVMFTDIENFTALGEKLEGDPETLTRFLNRFLTDATDAIQASGGTIDKYIGDGIMAFWNAPLDDPEHALHACRSGLAMGQRLGSVNEEIAAECAARGLSISPLSIRIGINTGWCFVGNMGSRQRFSYSALGDPVNVASRFEGQCKVYGSNILIGESVKSSIGGSELVATLAVDVVRLVGKAAPTRVYAVLGGQDLARDTCFTHLAAEHECMLQAYQAQTWDIAEERLATCQALGERFGLTKLYKLYSRRIAAFRTNPPGPGWDGVAIADTK
jgi:adenylate cyclase